MKRVYLLIVTSMIGLVAISQERVFTKNGEIAFYSKAPMENIEAHNKTAISVIDKTSGQMEFSVLMKGFEFEKALMQEHFNENYVESNKFPKANFKGKITDWNKVDIAKDGQYAVTVNGQLTIHGQTKDVEAKGNIIVKAGALSSSAEFNIVLDDYKIDVPAIVKDKIAKNVKIVVNATYEKM
jgi:polyisoprenoid-binding protein YceI